MTEEFFLTNLELRESTETGEVGSGLSHASMKGMVLLEVLELAALGEPRGAVTVVHDAGDHGGRYRELARDLGTAGWAVALPSLRGHGGTEGERGHSAGIREVVRDLGEVQDHLAYRLPDAPKVLIGQGLGALQCIAYAAENPGVAAALVLLAPLHEPRFHAPEGPKGLKRFFQKVGPTSPGRIGYEPSQLSGDAEQAADYARDERVHDQITLRAIEQAGEAARTYLPRVAELGLPVLVLHGSADEISAADASRALAGGSVDVEIVEGGLHRLLEDTAREATRARIVAWLDERLPR